MQLQDSCNPLVQLLKEEEISKKFGTKIYFVKVCQIVFKHTPACIPVLSTFSHTNNDDVYGMLAAISSNFEASTISDILLTEVADMSSGINKDTAVEITRPIRRFVSRCSYLARFVC